MKRLTFWSVTLFLGLVMASNLWFGIGSVFLDLIEFPAVMAWLGYANLAFAAVALFNLFAFVRNNRST